MPRCPCPTSITDIWRRLPLPGSALTAQIVDAARAARDPGKTLLDCPWNHDTDTFSKACRVAWRVSFRIQREQGGIPFITIPTERRAA
jgi:hypothetical protein